MARPLTRLVPPARVRSARASVTVTPRRCSRPGSTTHAVWRALAALPRPAGQPPTDGAVDVSLLDSPPSSETLIPYTACEQLGQLRRPMSSGLTTGRLRDLAPADGA